MARFDWVVFGPEADSVEALYVDKELRMWGDEYHKKISTAIHYYLCAVNDYEQHGYNFYRSELSENDEFCKEILDGKEPPKGFKDLPMKNLFIRNSVLPSLEEPE